MTSVYVPLTTLLHRSFCGELNHVPPIGFDEDEPEFEYHGESAHPDAVKNQCMCGHREYLSCPDYFGDWKPSRFCLADRHRQCDRSGFNRYTGTLSSDSCTCNCHIEGGYLRIEEEPDLW
jgi:hypothetical protein